MTQPAKVQEPSMEEILASIRRIIADDEAKPGAAEKLAAAAPPPPPKAEPTPPPAAKPAMKSPPPAAKAAAPAPKSPPPAAPASNSQDDIDSLLASLDEATPAAEIRPSPQPEAQPEADVFELTDDMALPEPAPAPSFRKVEPQDDVEFTEARTRAPVQESVREPVREPPAIETAPMQQIISGTTMRAVESAFNSLANTVLSNNARTLEDLVKEMLRPMLKSWLDDNLPGLVERIVKAEIERVSRGR
ncbi:hypothetical protein CK489_28705 [Bradyrhizobium sp. UFLA03-84]|uniref:PopZ family protein n=1 Tax=Bradyrhizobium sp. UFLA03-84 TaxID=418599 RepID=UPI000BAE39B4|nr:DUF2497 domain-containing protein [Bradyrhizobium sp. UFLA03-84]PAY05373.1 hypothetical protein CK489_28705 [Bradyrhizobium sp. UFLA03-84]